MVTGLDLDEVLRDSAPLIEARDSAALSKALAAEITSGRRRRLLRSRRRQLVASAVAGMVLMPAAAVAASHFAAQTGRYGKPGFTENDTSQYINMCARGIGQYVATLEPGSQPLPGGTTWDGIRRKLLREWRSSCPPNDSGLVMQVTGIKVDYLMASQCPWERAFLHASGRGAAAERRQAGQAIVRSDDAISAIGGWGDSNWKIGRDRAAHGDSTWIAREYQVNCLAPSTPSGQEPK